MMVLGPLIYRHLHVRCAHVHIVNKYQRNIDWRIVSTPAGFRVLHSTLLKHSSSPKYNPIVMCDTHKHMETLAYSIS